MPGRLRRFGGSAVLIEFDSTVELRCDCRGNMQAGALAIPALAAIFFREVGRILTRIRVDGWMPATLVYFVLGYLALSYFMARRIAVLRAGSHLRRGWRLARHRMSVRKLADDESAHQQ